MKKLVIAVCFLSFVFTSCSKKDDDPEPEPEVTNAISTYTNIEFSVKHGDTEYARFFSTETGKSYKDSEVDAANGPKIDIVFEQMATSVNYFISPDNKAVKLIIPGASMTKFINYVKEPNIAEFDALTNGDKLAILQIEKDDNNSFGPSDFPKLVFFENAAGKKGIIKVTAINAERLLADIKVQK